MLHIQLVHDHYDSAHLTQVTEEMRTRGAPTIRAVHVDGDYWRAIEGCHRLRAAIELGLVPDLVSVNWDTAADIVNAESGDCWTGNELAESYDRDRAIVILDFP